MRFLSRQLIFATIVGAAGAWSVRAEPAPAPASLPGLDNDSAIPVMQQQQQRRQRQRQGQDGDKQGRGACTGYTDTDNDGICDHCNRTTLGCPGRRVAGDPESYAGMASMTDYEANTTLENLQAAYTGESNAANKYTLFAAKADEEGFDGVASLFRAAAKAEEVHAANHAEVIRELGATPTAVIADVEVGTTRENLEHAIAGESYEWDVMYPGMLNRARQDRARQAIRSFNFAMIVESHHARFYRAALADLDSWKTQRDFYVCTVCGETVDKIDFKKCPNCFVRVEEYVKVS